MSLTIKTNRQPRPLLAWSQLTGREQEHFSHYGEGVTESDFFRYRGAVYSTLDFMFTGGVTELAEWDGYLNDSVFSGVVVRFPRDGESVVCGTFYS